MLRMLILPGAESVDLMIQIGMGKICFLPTINLIALPSMTSVECRPLKDIHHPLGITHATTQLLKILQLFLL
jgi:hypothetical protein